jgi:hypothetical protein
MRKQPADTAKYSSQSSMGAFKAVAWRWMLNMPYEFLIPPLYFDVGVGSSRYLSITMVASGSPIERPNR